VRRVQPQEDWPEHWKTSYAYDLLEVYGEPRGNRGYAYAYRNRREATLDLVRRAAPSGAAVLDVAAAQGNFSLLLAEMGYRVTWNDLREGLADYVGLKRERGEIEFRPGNVFGLDLPDAFDVVLLLEVIEHVAHPEELLRKAAGLVRPGGHVVLTTPNGRYLANRLPRLADIENRAELERMQFKPDADGHLFLLHPDDLPGLAGGAGLVLREVRHFTNPLTAGHMKLSPLLGLLPGGLVRALDRVTRASPAFLRHRLHAHMAAFFERPGRHAPARPSPSEPARVRQGAAAKGE